MNQETVNAFYNRLEELRNTFDEYLVAHDTSEGAASDTPYPYFAEPDGKISA